MTSDNPPEARKCAVYTLDEARMTMLKDSLSSKGWDITEGPNMHFKAALNKTSVAAYHSGKLVIQGAGTEDFITFTLEPEILGELAFGPDSDCMKKTEPEKPFKPHAGVDESGKGDFFGPLVIASVFVADEDTAKELAKLGARDSKLIKNDKVMEVMAPKIKAVVKGAFSVVAIGPESYNRFYDKIGSLNRLLAWGHARAIENILEKAPECKMALSDKFGDESLIKNALMTAGRSIILEQKTKAESDIAVAAASILTRAEFVRRIRLLGEENGCTLPKGAGTEVDKTAAQLAVAGGRELLSKVAKMHFRNSYKALGLEAPPKPDYRQFLRNK